MTVKELVEILQKYDDETEVKICDSRLPFFDPIEIFDFDFDYLEDGVITIVGD